MEDVLCFIEWTPGTKGLNLLLVGNFIGDIRTNGLGILYKAYYIGCAMIYDQFLIIFDLTMSVDNSFP